MNSTRVKVPNICVASVSECQYEGHYKVKGTWNMLLISPSPSVYSVSLYGHQFSSYSTLCGNCTVWTQNDTEDHKVKWISCICVFSVTESSISICFTRRCDICELQTISREYTKWTQMTLKRRGQMYPINVLLVLRGPNFRFAQSISLYS